MRDEHRSTVDRSTKSTGASVAALVVGIFSHFPSFNDYQPSRKMGRVEMSEGPSVSIAGFDIFPNDFAVVRSRHQLGLSVRACLRRIYG